MAEPIKVLVVDDSTFMRGALVRMIERSPDFKVIDVASNGEEGVKKAQQLKPDVITMDIEMPVMNGIEALTQIMATVKTPVVMISTLTEHGAEATLKAMEIGAVDFLPKALTDKDKNIFKSAEEIHARLRAAAGAQVVPASKPAPRVRPAGVVNVRELAAKMVVIGSSTGGPRALQAVLKALPAHFPAPVVVAQHMPADFTRVLARRLDEVCKIEVVEAQNGEVPMPGKVYVAPGGMHLRLLANGFEVAPNQGESTYQPSVDVLAESAHQLYGKHLVGVMLTGMGSDGAKAFGAMKDSGAYIIAQDAGSCVVYGMPKAVAEAGKASEVLALEQIGPRLNELLGL